MDDDMADIKQSFNLSRMCRSCLKESQDEDMNEIFDSAGNQNLHQILMSLTSSIQIEINDGMPDKLCRNCTEHAKSAYNFKITLEQSDSTLRDYLFKDQIKQIKKDTFEDNNYLMNIKTEIAFVDADPFIDDDEDDDENDPDYPEPSDNNERYSKSDESFNNSYVEPQGPDQDPDQDQIPEDPDEDDEEKIVTRDRHRKYKLPEHLMVDKVEYVKDTDGKYVCQICNKKLCDKKGLNLHVRLHTGEKLKRCNICNRGFIKSDHLKRHLLIHERNITCEYCQETFESRSDYKNHMREIHNEDPDNIEKPKKKQKKSFIPKPPIGGFIVSCKICDTRFRKITELQNHLHQHVLTNEFDDVDLKNKFFLFNPMEIDLEKTPNEELHGMVKGKINENDCEKFYQILTKEGEELTLSDSDSEDENELAMDHMQEQGKRFYNCTRCERLFRRLKEVSQHMNQDHQEDMHEFLDKCIHCQKVFPNQQLLIKHIHRQCENKSKKFVCNVCGMKFMWVDSMARHIEIEHPGAEKLKLFNCLICGKAFSRAEHLERHRKTHNPSEKKFECTICQKKFNRKDNLRSHMKIHKDNRDDEDKHLCIYCGRSFSNSSNLIVHMRRHTGEKPYKCDLCDKGFPRSSDLQCHRRTHTGEKPCLCTICGKGFSRSNKLVRHMRIHTGVRPYQCTYCDRAFTQSNDLTLHIRRHTGEKPYVCGVCGDRFIQGTALKQHQRMQGHFEGTQPSPFAAISVNNPSRYTNSNLVNRRYMLDQQQQNSNPPVMPIKPVIPRRRTANNTNIMNPMMVPHNSNNMPGASTSIGLPLMPSTSTMHMNNDTTSDVISLKSTSPHPSHSSMANTPVSTPVPHNLSGIDVKPNIQNLNIPQSAYNGMPHLNMMPNMEIATLFTMSFNQNFNNSGN